MKSVRKSRKLSVKKKISACRARGLTYNPRRSKSRCVIDVKKRKSLCKKRKSRSGKKFVFDRKTRKCRLRKKSSKKKIKSKKSASKSSPTKSSDVLTIFSK